MGNCIYCGQKAGLFKSKHNECESSYFEGKNKIVDFIYNSIANEKDFEKLSNDINSLLKKHNINESEKNDLFVQGFDTTIDKFLEDGILSTNEEDSIDKFREHYHFDQSILDKNGSIQKLVKSAILREVLNGKLPENKVKIKGELPFMLEKTKP
jgi:hypothetical protein